MYSEICSILDFLVENLKKEDRYSHLTKQIAHQYKYNIPLSTYKKANPLNLYSIPISLLH